MAFLASESVLLPLLKTSLSLLFSWGYLFLKLNFGFVASKKPLAFSRGA